MLWRHHYVTYRGNRGSPDQHFGDVDAVEHRAFKLLDIRILARTASIRSFRSWKINPSAPRSGEFHQLRDRERSVPWRSAINTINVREANFRCRRSEVHFFAPASRAISIICSEVVPRTRSRRPAGRFYRGTRRGWHSVTAHGLTTQLLARHDKGAANMRFLTKPWRYGLPRIRAISSGYHTRFLGSGSPRRYPDLPIAGNFLAQFRAHIHTRAVNGNLSINESGRAKYTYSNRHGLRPDCQHIDG